MIGFIMIIIIVSIICSSFLFGFYMSCCKENEVGMFKKTTYDEERLNELEQRIEMLENRNLRENV
jgi:hypothetical protein